MAHSYHQFYIGDSRLHEGDFSKEQPRLLTFSKIGNGPMEEASSHLHTHLEIFYFESGCGVFESGEHSIPIRAHDLVVANAQCIHVQYSSDPESPLIYYNFAVDRLKLPGCALNSISNSDFEYRSFGTPDNPFYRTVKELLLEFRSKDYGYHLKVNSLFFELLIDTARLFRDTEKSIPAEKPPSTSLLLETKRYIDLHYQENLALCDLTQLSYMQKSHFSHSFKKCFGIAPMKYLNLVRIENAKLLLLRSEGSVAEIAREVGFGTPSYFSELFLKTTGESPTDYRKRVKQLT